MFKGARGAGAADAGPDGQLAELFARLQTAVDDHAHKKALKISESILEASPGDADATRCKVVALLELARYADAVACVSAGVRAAALSGRLTALCCARLSLGLGRCEALL